VLRFSWWGGGARHAATLKAIAAFEARHPDIRIKPEYMGIQGYLEKLTTQIVSGTEPDVMQVDWAWLAMFSRRGDGFYDLQRLKHLIALDQFTPDDLDMGSIAGRLNGLPVSYTARLFVWNKASFERAGLPLPATWDELLAAGPAFAQRLGERAFPMDGETYDALLLTHAYVFQKYGEPYVHANEPRVAMSPQALLEWVRLYRRLVDAHVLTPVPYRASLGGARKALEQQQDWVVGNWAGNYTWDSALPARLATLDAHQQLDIGPFLTLPEAHNSGMFGRPAMLFAVSKKTARPEHAAKFLNFLLTDPEAARLLGLTRGVPAAASAYRVLRDEKRVGPLQLKAYEQIDRARRAGRIARPSPLFEDARFHKFMREVFDLVAYGKIDDEEAARRLLADGNGLLARIGKR
jgi:oligogalacturonide transport system substrate-binding protein